MTSEIPYPQPGPRPAFFSAPCRVDGVRVYDSASNLVATVAYRRDTADEERATRLISAAPELLAACQKFMNGISILNDGPDDSDVAHAHNQLVESFKLARAAIAKATGAAA